jgi:hypothetical protein
MLFLPSENEKPAHREERGPKIGGLHEVDFVLNRLDQISRQTAAFEAELKGFLDRFFEVVASVAGEALADVLLDLRNLFGSSFSVQDHLNHFHALGLMVAMRFLFTHGRWPGFLR